MVLEQAIRRIVADALRRAGVPYWGKVASVSPDGSAVRVLRQPEGTVGGWMPIVRPAGGAQGAGYIAKTGWQVFVVPDRGDAEHGVAMGFANNAAQPLPVVPNHAGTGGTPNTTPAPWQPGEAFLIGPTGNVIRLNADGTVAIIGSVTIEGDLRVNGNVSDRYGSLNGFRAHYNAHTHGGVQAGGNSTGIPNLTDP